MEHSVFGDYTGKVVVITGAGGVICGAMARAFAAAGAKVAALNRSAEKLTPLVEECAANGWVCRGYAVNVLDKAGLCAVREQILAELGPCDVLVNGAGGNDPAAQTSIEFHSEAKEDSTTFFDLQESGVDKVFALNFQGTLLPTQVFAADMAKRGSGNILNISSMNAFVPLTKIPAYSGAKAAVSNFTQWMATYFAASGVRCNAVAPGFVATKQNEKLLYNPDGTPTARTQKILAGTPMRRFVTSEELLGAALFLCDDRAASAVTGVVLPVDGGFAAYAGV